VRVLLAFLLLVTLGSMWESRTNRVPRTLPLLALSALVSIVFFTVSRVV
jgi:hypothetical protein